VIYSEDVKSFPRERERKQDRKKGKKTREVPQLARIGMKKVRKERRLQLMAIMKL